MTMRAHCSTAEYEHLINGSATDDYSPILDPVQSENVRQSIEQRAVRLEEENSGVQRRRSPPHCAGCARPLHPPECIPCNCRAKYARPNQNVSGATTWIIHNKSCPLAEENPRGAYLGSQKWESKWRADTRKRMECCFDEKNYFGERIKYYKECFRPLGQ